MHSMKVSLSPERLNLNKFSGDYTYALISYLRAAQMGLEYGQSNAAWMLEHGLAPGKCPPKIRILKKCDFQVD